MGSLEGHEIVKWFQETSLQTCIERSPIKKVILDYRKDFGDLTITEIAHHSSSKRSKLQRFHDDSKTGAFTTILHLVMLWTLREIRKGKVSSKDQWRKFPEHQCFTIFWGTEFQLEWLTFAGINPSFFINRTPVDGSDSRQ